MEFKYVIENRRSIRKFTSENVDNDILIELIRLATLAPSAHNRQPWRFMIVRGKQKDAIVSMMDSFYDENREFASNSMPYTSLVMKEANALIAVFKDGLEEHSYVDLLSIGASIEHLCLGATSLGLGSLWINDVDPIKRDISNYLGYSDLELVSVIAIGYANQNPKPRPRKVIDEVILK